MYIIYGCPITIAVLIQLEVCEDCLVCGFVEPGHLCELLGMYSSYCIHFMILFMLLCASCFK